MISIVTISKSFFTFWQLQMSRSIYLHIVSVCLVQGIITDDRKLSIQKFEASNFCRVSTRNINIICLMYNRDASKTVSHAWAVRTFKKNMQLWIKIVNDISLDEMNVNVPSANKGLPILDPKWYMYHNNKCLNLRKANKLIFANNSSKKKIIFI